MSGGAPGGRRRFLFVHLQKTAGTALLRRLRHHFGPDAVWPPPGEQGTPTAVLDVDHLLRRLDELGDRIQVVTGHYPLCVADLMGGDVATFTVLRDPVERTLSFLRHQLEVEPRFAGQDVASVYDDPVGRSELVQNHMVRMLSLRADELAGGALTPIVLDGGRLDAARANLEHRIDVMGVQEHFEPFCDELAARFGWDLGPAVFMNRTQPAPAPDGLRERIAADNALDVELYRFAVELWAARHP